MTDYPHRNGATLAAILPGTSERQLQSLLTVIPWDATALNQQRVDQLRAIEELIQTNRIEAYRPQRN